MDNGSMARKPFGHGAGRLLDIFAKLGYLAKQEIEETMSPRNELRSKVFKALGHPSRILMVDALLQGERCVCELREIVGADMSTVSKHLSVLKEAGIVQDDKRGTSVYYSLRMECVRGFLACVDRFQARQAEERIEALKSEPLISSLE